MPASRFGSVSATHDNLGMLIGSGETGPDLDNTDTLWRTLDGVSFEELAPMPSYGNKT